MKQVTLRGFMYLFLTISILSACKKDDDVVVSKALRLNKVSYSVSANSFGTAGDLIKLFYTPAEKLNRIEIFDQKGKLQEGLSIVTLKEGTMVLSDSKSDSLSTKFINDGLGRVVRAEITAKNLVSHSTYTYNDDGYLAMRKDDSGIYTRYTYAGGNLMAIERYDKQNHLLYSEAYEYDLTKNVKFNLALSEGLLENTLYALIANFGKQSGKNAITKITVQTYKDQKPAGKPVVTELSAYEISQEGYIKQYKYNFALATLSFEYEHN